MKTTSSNMITRSLVRHPWRSLKAIMGQTSVDTDAFWLERLRHAQRYQAGTATLSKGTFHYIDAPSFAYQYLEIFQQQIYHVTLPQDPYIIDAGANIGLASVYFAKNYPNARILAFEPQQDACRAFEKNTAGYKNIELHQTALWKEAGEIQLHAAASDASSITATPDTSNTVTVCTEPLLPFLSKRVDFLKIDIEGAEHELLLASAPGLTNVQSIFIEYHNPDFSTAPLNDIIHLLEKHGFRTFIRSLTAPRSIHEAMTSPQHPFAYQINIFGFKTPNL